jgi:cytochrome b561
VIQVSRYHPLLVALHWFLAVFIIAALALGALVLAPRPNSSPMKIEGLRAHIIGGALILILMGLRFVVRQLSALPAPAPTGSRLLDGLSFVSHRAFYLLVLAQVASGLTMAVQANLFAVVFLHHGSLPHDFWIYEARTMHYVFSRTLMLLIALHIAGVLYHTFIRRDHLLRRMWFGRRSEAAAALTHTRATSMP